MTTNHPEKLDDALIRPGRVDHQVAFNNATQAQIKELFERMYSNDLPRTKIIVNSTPSLKTPELVTVVEKDINGTANGIANGTAENGTAHPKFTPAETLARISALREKFSGASLSDAELRSIAVDFAAKIPDHMFSPAEIQGFLLKRKKDPRRAVAEVDKWVESMAEVKRKGMRVVDVQ